MRLRTLLAVALTAGALAAPQAHAAPRETVVSGSTTGYVDVDVRYSGVVHLNGIETRGRFGGVYLQQLTRKSGGPPETLPLGGFVAIRGLSPNGDSMDAMPLYRVPYVEWGRVRIYLVADGPTTVRLDFGGMNLAPLRPTRRTSAKAVVTAVPRAGAGWSGTVPIQVAPFATSLVALQVRGELATYADATVCLRQPDATCPDSATPGFGNSTGGGGTVGSLEEGARWYAGTLTPAGPSGRLVGSASVSHVRDLAYARVAAFTLTLVH